MQAALRLRLRTSGLSCFAAARGTQRRFAICIRRDDGEESDLSLLIILAQIVCLEIVHPFRHASCFRTSRCCNDVTAHTYCELVRASKRSENCALLLSKLAHLAPNGRVKFRGAPPTDVPASLIIDAGRGTGDHELATLHRFPHVAALVPPSIFGNPCAL